MKNCDGPETFHRSAWKIPAATRRSIPGEADGLRPDGRNEWYILHHLSFCATHFTLPPTIIYLNPFLRKNIYAKSAPTAFREEASKKHVVALTDVRRHRVVRRVASRKISETIILRRDKISLARQNRLKSLSVSFATYRSSPT